MADPKRAEVAEHLVSWEVEHPAYVPAYFVANVVIEHDCTGSGQLWTEDSREHNSREAEQNRSSSSEAQRPRPAPSTSSRLSKADSEHNSCRRHDSSHRDSSRRNSTCSDRSAAASAAAKAAASQMAAMGLFSPAGVAGGTAGPAWARGEVEAPQGARRTATGYAVAVYTPEQHLRTLLLNSGHEDKFVRGSWEDAEEAGMANHLQAAEQWKARHTARSPLPPPTATHLAIHRYLSLPPTWPPPPTSLPPHGTKRASVSPCANILWPFRAALATPRRTTPHTRFARSLLGLVTYHRTHDRNCGPTPKTSIRSPTATR